MPLPNSTPSINRRITFSAGASLTPSIGQWSPDPLSEDAGVSDGRHLFSAPVAGHTGSTLFIGIRWYGGTSDRIEMTEPVLMRLLCLALVQQLPEDALGGAALCLSGMNEFQRALSPETAIVSRGQWFSSGINSLIQKRVAALPNPNEVLSFLSGLRDQLIDSVDYVDHEMTVLVERLELGDLSQPDHDAARHVSGAVARHVPDDTVLACDPD